MISLGGGGSDARAASKTLSGAAAFLEDELAMTTPAVPISTGRTGGLENGTTIQLDTRSGPIGPQAGRMWGNRGVGGARFAPVASWPQPAWPIGGEGAPGCQDRLGSRISQREDDISSSQPLESRRVPRRMHAVRRGTRCRSRQAGRLIRFKTESEASAHGNCKARSPRHRAADQVTALR